VSLSWSDVIRSLGAGERNEVRRHTAILVLRELATNAPTLFYPHVPQFFDVIVSAVRDPKVQCTGHGKGLAGTASYSCAVLCQLG
jgi:hypothetical protein